MTLFSISSVSTKIIEDEKMNTVAISSSVEVDTECDGHKHVRNVTKENIDLVVSRIWILLTYK